MMRKTAEGKALEEKIATQLKSKTYKEAMDEKRIKELESSISALDWELERIEIEKMKKKTNVVKKRMLANHSDQTKLSSG